MESQYSASAVEDIFVKKHRFAIVKNPGFDIFWRTVNLRQKMGQHL